MLDSHYNLSEPTVALLVNSLQSGGTEKQSVFLFNVLKNKYKTIFIIFHGDLIDENMLKLIDSNNYQLVKLRGNGLYKVRILYNILKNNRVSILFTYLTKPNFLGGIIGKLAGVKEIFGGIRSTKFPIWKSILEKMIMRFFTSGTIFNSFLAEDKFSKELKAKKSIVIPNCFPFVKKVTIRPQKQNITIISVGRFHESKDYVTAIRAVGLAVEKYSNLKYQIIGYGKLEPTIKEWINEFNLNDKIELLINPSNISELLDKADIYLSTSKYEGTSNSIMEAMNASLPIVATNVGDNNRLVHQGKSGYLHDTGDYKNISNSLLILINNYESRIKLGIESNIILKENYSYEKFENSYIELIEGK